MRHSAPRPARSAGLRAPVRSAGRALARLSGLLVLAVTLVAAAGIVYVVHGQAAPPDGVRLAAATRAQRHHGGAENPAEAGSSHRTGHAAGARAGDGTTREEPAAATRTGAGPGTGSDAAGAGDSTGKSGARAGSRGAADAARPDAAQPRTGQPQTGQPQTGQGGHRDGDHRREAPPAGTAPNPDCTLVVPDAPTSATGLATPYRLVATDRRAGACRETDADQSAFVEAAILSPSTGEISIYHPLVVDAGARPAAAPVPVTLPQDAVVGVWFGFNGDTLTLSGPGAQDCVNGLPGSPFGQFAYCNAPAFFQAANGAIAAGKLAVPDLGTAKDGLPCPTTRDFVVVDQDQSDNLATAYRIVDGRMAQDTAATRSGTKLTNGSDEGLLANAIDPALGCSPWKAPDLGDPGTMVPALALNELSAATHQAKAGAEALVPVSDPMVLVDGRTSTEKTNLYRAGVNMPPLPEGQQPQEYCQALRAVAVQRLTQAAGLLAGAPSPGPDTADLLQFLRARLQGTLQMLDCQVAPRK